MKKVVVVVSRKLITHKLGNLTSIDFRTEEFEGNLKVIDSSSPGLTHGKTLVIEDSDETIAVFNHWLYWKKLE